MGADRPVLGLAGWAVSPLAIDYAWTHPDPAQIVATGYQYVLRYLSNDASKDLTEGEALALFAAGILGICPVGETTATRALEGSGAGQTDATNWTARMAAMGMPPGTTLFMAVDTDTSWASVAPYFAGGVGAQGAYDVRPYGGIKIIDGFAADYGKPSWQTVAWSGGRVSSNAAIYQRISPTLPPIPGAGGGYDEDEVILPINWWTTHPAPSHARPELWSLTLS